MRSAFLLFALFVTGATRAWACPDPAVPAPTIAATGPELLAPRSWPITAGGPDGAPCPLWVETILGVPDEGARLPRAPSLQVRLTGMGPHILMVRAQAPCDPVLIARTGDGVWYFGEAGDAGPQATLWGAADGILQVWVGAREERGCGGTVTLETFDR